MSASQPSALPPRPGVFSHRLSWIAMVVMAAMCALTLIWAASLSVE